MPSGSRPLTGSSKRSTPGSPSSAPAMPSRWPMPSEYLPARRSATAVSPTRSRTSSTRPSGISLVWARIAGGCGRCGRGGTPWHRAGRRPRGAASAARRSGAVHHGAPGIGRVEAHDHAHGGRLAGAVGAEEAGDDTRGDREAEVVDRQGLAVALRQSVGDDHDAGSFRGPCRPQSQHAPGRHQGECRYRASGAGATPSLFERAGHRGGTSWARISPPDRSAGGGRGRRPGPGRVGGRAVGRSGVAGDRAGQREHRHRAHRDRARLVARRRR